MGLIKKGMQQLKTLKVMGKNELLHNIENNYLRSQNAYKIYKKNPTYYNAKLIYNSNQNLYVSLNELLKFKLEDETKNEVFNYIFHLEHWFLQFEEHEKKIKSIETEFVFKSFKDYIPFPNNFIKKIK